MTAAEHQMIEPQEDLDTRAAVDDLLVSFYSSAMTDELLGPVFALAHLDLQHHLPRIGDFWERTLLGSGTYDGQPMVVHRALHRLVPLTPALFDRWLDLWAAAVDARAHGPRAELAKTMALRIASAIQRQLNNPELLQIVSPSRPV